MNYCCCSCVQIQAYQLLWRCLSQYHLHSELDKPVQPGEDCSTCTVNVHVHHAHVSEENDLTFYRNFSNVFKTLNNLLYDSCNIVAYMYIYVRLSSSTLIVLQEIKGLKSPSSTSEKVFRALSSTTTEVLHPFLVYVCICVCVHTNIHTDS